MPKEQARWNQSSATWRNTTTRTIGVDHDAPSDPVAAHGGHDPSKDADAGAAPVKPAAPKAAPPAPAKPAPAKPAAAPKK